MAPIVETARSFRSRTHAARPHRRRDQTRQECAGHIPLVDFLLSFRYPLAGEVAMTRELAASLRPSAGWGLEIGQRTAGIPSGPSRNRPSQAPDSGVPGGQRGGRAVRDRLARFGFHQRVFRDAARSAHRIRGQQYLERLAAGVSRLRHRSRPAADARCGAGSPAPATTSRI